MMGSVHKLRLRRREVVRFADVVLEVKELPAALGLGFKIARVDEFPSTLTDGLLRTEAPVERGVRRRRFFARKIG